MSSKKRIITSYFVLAILTLVFLALNVCIGSVSIPISDVGTAIFGKGTETVYDIVMKIRLPRALSAAVLGGALALSGYLLQTYFHNPIAGPFVLGISSSAKLMVALTMVICLGNNVLVKSSYLIIAAFIGAIISVAFVLLLAGRVKSMAMLIVGGVMIGYICTAVTDFVVTFADDSNIVNIHNWTKGSFSGMNMDNVIQMSVVIFLAMIAVFLLSKPIGAYLLGEAYANSMGVNILVFRFLIILLSSILAATVTAFAGPVSFVGIAVPQLTKRLFKSAKPIVLIPGTFLGGALFCLVCDLIARCAFTPTELSISTVTAVFGAPVVLFVLVSKRRDA